MFPASYGTNIDIDFILFTIVISIIFIIFSSMVYDFFFKGGHGDFFKKKNKKIIRKGYCCKDIFEAINLTRNELLKYDKDFLVHIILFLRSEREHWMKMYAKMHNDWIEKESRDEINENI